MSHQLSEHQELLPMEGNTQQRAVRPRQLPEEGRVSIQGCTDTRRHHRGGRE